MVQPAESKRDAVRRAARAVLAVLPRSVKARVLGQEAGVDLLLADQSLRIRWLGAGHLGDARTLLAHRGPRPDVVVAPRLSPGAREALSRAGVGWADETGAAEIAVGSIVVSRTGRPPVPVKRPMRWTPSVLAVAEALLLENRGTVSAMQAATGLSTGSSTNALRVLTDLGLLKARTARGRGSAREVADPDRLLGAYASAVEATPPRIGVEVGVIWPDPVAGLVELGGVWAEAGLAWAATGAAAAAVIAPFLGSLTSSVAYVDADTVAGLLAVAADAGLRPIEGGRLTLHPFPTVAVRRLAGEFGGLRVAPWPRVYADLRTSGVRGEEAAEHLREVIRAG